MPSVKQLLTNKPFMIMFFFIGGAMGYISCVSTKIEQIMCASGYSDQVILAKGNYYNPSQNTDKKHCMSYVGIWHTEILLTKFYFRFLAYQDP